MDTSELELLEGLSDGYRLGGSLRLVLGADLDLGIDFDFVFVFAATFRMGLVWRFSAGGRYHESSSSDPSLAPPMDLGTENSTTFFLESFFFFSSSFFFFSALVGVAS